MELIKKLPLRLSLIIVFAVPGIFQKLAAQTPPVALPAQMIGNSGFEFLWYPFDAMKVYEINIATNDAFTENAKVFNVNLDNLPADDQLFGPDRHLSRSGSNIWYTITELSPSTKYYCRIRAMTGVIGLPYSNVVEVTTEAHPPQVSPLSWVTTINNPSGVAEVQSMVGDDDGNIYAAGHYSNSIVAGTKTLTSNGGDDMFIMKLNSTGAIVWAQSIGGTGNDGEASLALDSSGLYVVGIFRNSIDLDPGAGTKILTNAGVDAADGFYAKFKPSDGTLIWAGQMVDALTWSPASINLDTTGIYIAGFFTNTSNLGTTNTQFVSKGFNDIFFGKYNLKDGKAIWAKSIGGPFYDGARAMDLEAGALYIAGFFNGNGDWNTGTVNSTVDFDPGNNTTNLSPGGGFLAKYSGVDGSLVFAKGFTGSANFMCNPWTIDANKSSVYISGFYHGTINFDAASNTTHIAEDIGAFIGQYKTSDGNAVWVKSLRVTRFIHPRRIMVDNAGFYLSGGFDASVNFDPAGSNAGNRVGVIGYDNFIARYALDGTFAWVKTLDVVSIAPAARTSDGYFLGGMFWKSVNFDPYQGSSIRTPNGNGMFVAKYKAVSPPFVPAALKMSSVDTTSFSSEWKPMAGATSYSVDLSTDNFNTTLPGYNGVSVTAESKTFTNLDANATYYWRVRAVNSYGFSDDSQVMKVVTSCPVKPSILADNSNPASPKLTSSSPNGNQWFLNGEAIPNANSQSLMASQTGSYTVQVTIAGCKSKMSDLKVVAITGINLLVTESLLHIFPNPAGETVSIRLEDFVSDKGVMIEVFDLMGRKLNPNQMSEGNIITLDISTLSKGVFIIKASISGKHSLHRLAKQ